MTINEDVKKAESSPIHDDRERIVIAVDSHFTRILVPGVWCGRAEMSVVLLVEEKPIGVGEWVRTFRMYPWRPNEIVKPFANLDTFKKYFDAAVYFISEMVRKYVPRQGLLRRLLHRSEVCVALPSWLMAETELALKFHNAVARRLRAYSVAFVDDKASLVAYAIQRSLNPQAKR